MPSTWAPNDWLSTDAITHTRLNNIGNSIRTWGYGETAGTVTINANQSALSALGVLTFHSSGYIAQDAWSTFTMQNSWTDVGVANGYRAASYVLDKQRHVHIDMLIQPGTGFSPVVALPIGFSPSAHRRISVYNASTGITTMATVSTAGAITLLGSFSSGHFVHVFGSFPID